MICSSCSNTTLAFLILTDLTFCSITRRGVTTRPKLYSVGANSLWEDFAASMNILELKSTNCLGKLCSMFLDRNLHDRNNHSFNFYIMQYARIYQLFPLFIGRLKNNGRVDQLRWFNIRRLWWDSGKNHAFCLIWSFLCRLFSSSSSTPQLIKFILTSLFIRLNLETNSRFGFSLN